MSEADPIPEQVKSKVGPLPIWAWVIVGAGVLGAVLIIRRGGTATPAVPTAVGQTSGAPPGNDPNGGTMNDLLMSMQNLIETSNRNNSSLINAIMTQNKSTGSTAAGGGASPGNTGGTLNAIAAKYGVSATWIQQYLARFREPGFAEAFAGTNPVNTYQVQGYQTFQNAPIGKAVAEAQAAGLG